MYREEIKRFNQDGFLIAISVVPDEDMTFYESEEPPKREDEPEYYPKWLERKEAFERGDFHYIGVIAEAMLIIDNGNYRKAIKLGDDSLWGVESNDTEYIEEELIPELTEEAIGEAKAHIQAIKDSVDKHFPIEAQDTSNVVPIKREEV